MSFPTPWANEYREQVMLRILKHAHDEGVELHTFEEFEQYRDDYVRKFMLDPDSPQYNFGWALRGIERSRPYAMFKSFTAKVWREMQEC